MPDRRPSSRGGIDCGLIIPAICLAIVLGFAVIGLVVSAFVGADLIADALLRSSS